MKDVVKTWGYKLVSNLVILLTFVNSITYLATHVYEFKVLDDIFEAIFVVDIGLRLIGLGWEAFFKDKWNHLDFYLVSIILVLDILPHDKIPHNSDVICKMFRIFRITTLIKLFRGTDTKL